MTNAARKPRLINDIVVLTNEQAQLYRHHHYLTLKTRDGELVDVISQNLVESNADNVQEAINRLRLLEIMFANQRDSLELDAEALTALADILMEAQQFLTAE